MVPVIKVSDQGGLLPWIVGKHLAISRFLL
jgi:hypothetical protein